MASRALTWTPYGYDSYVAVYELIYISFVICACDVRVFRLRHVHVLLLIAPPTLTCAWLVGLFAPISVLQGMPLEQLHALFALSKVLYESGNYGLASAALKVYRKCSPSAGPEVRTV